MYPRDLRFLSVYFIFDAQTRFNMHDPMTGKGHPDPAVAKIPRSFCCDNRPHLEREFR